MTCTQCAREIEADSVFCRHCGSEVDAGRPAPRRLTRRSSEGRLGGVCAGIAEYFDADVTLVRLAWVILSIFPGGILGGVLAYIAAWIVMPDETRPAAQSAAHDRRLTRSVVDRKIAGVCGGLAAFFRVDSTVVRLVWVILSIVPGGIVFGVAAYLVAWIIMPERAAAPAQAAQSAA
jgi:phage shock protein PspC (stress-responsive transcriptional regulator)